VRRTLPLALLFLASPAVAQAPPAVPKRPLQYRDTDIWNTTAGMKLSPDGNWLAYTLSPPTGDAAVVIRHLPAATETRLPTGGRTPTPPGATETPNAPPPGPPEPPAAVAAPAAGGPQFSPDSTKVVVGLTPTAAEAAKAKGERPAPGVAIIELKSGQVVARLTRVRNFTVAGDGAGVLLYQPEPKPADPLPAAAVLGGVMAVPGVRPRPAADLVIRSLADAAETTIPDVAEFAVTKDQKLVVGVTAGPAAARVFAVGLSPAGPEAVATVHAAAGRFSRLTWNDDQSRLAFFHAEVPAPGPAGAPPRPRVFVWDRAKPGPAKEVVGPAPAGLPAGWAVAERGGLAFSLDGLKLTLYTAPPPLPEPKRATTQAPTAGPPRPPRGAGRGAPGAAANTPPAPPADDKVDLDIWHWKDEAVQPMQKVRAAADRLKTYRAVCLLDTGEVRQLSTAHRDVPVPNYGDWAVASSDKAYRGQLWRLPAPRDYSCVNVRTGEEKPLLREFDGVVTAPFGDYAVAFDGKDWQSYAVPGGERVNLTAKLGGRFDNEEFDLPASRPPAGLTGFTADRKSVVISDRYDLWKLPLDGSIATNLTQIGRTTGVGFTIVGLGDDFSTLKLDFSQPVLLAAENPATRDTGFYRLEPGRKPTLLVMGARRYGTPVQAKKADAMLLTASTFADFPDYYLADRDFREVKKVTDLQPRTREFNWASAELVHYKSADGVPLQGMLVKPADFDPAKKYPMVVYIYERLSNNLHGFRLPTVGTSINPTYYASNGYLVFMPDIVYTTGAPGQSALKCVLPAIQAVADRGYVNENAIGIQGHSWGGYQIAYLVTQTTRFKAAAAGAPVANMTSAYGGIRWGTGLPRQFQYEHSQSRIGGSLWQSPMKYIENSPVFMADRVTTPLLMLHNDQDDAVPWYQGIEYYLALRRLGKEVYLLNYNGEFHGLRKKANQRDYTVRMQQFFDHHLKGAPAPDWMVRGVPYAERDVEKEGMKKLFPPEPAAVKKD